ncbi:hypothetical protein BJV82DRAFT_575842 [Fennellomyces sp. T-0311]|nr:hypothetical protein BJV82DRAFT_575842 [Fennellomyces sp. T-0311]
MDRSRFFQENEEPSFASYSAQTRSTCHKTKLSALKSIFHDDVNDLKAHMNECSENRKAKLGDMKTNFSDEELQDLASGTNSTATTNNTTIGTMNVGGVTLNIGSSHQEHTQEQLPPRKRDVDPEVPQPLPKRQRAKAMHPDFTDSGAITDSDGFEGPSSQLSNASSFTPSDLGSTPAGYIWEFNTYIPQSPSPIPNAALAALVEEAHKLASDKYLSPYNLRSRLETSAIFKSSAIANINNAVLAQYDLPNSIYANIRCLERSIQRKELYLPPNSSTNMEEIALNSILTSIYTFHGKQPIKSYHSEIHLIAMSISLFLGPIFSAHDPIQLDWDVTSWIYKQHDNVDPHKLRPDIIFNIQGKDGVMEIGCGEVKKSDVDFDTKEEAKIRVIEIMKRQLNLRLKLAKKLYEGVTFGVVVIASNVGVIIETRTWK